MNLPPIPAQIIPEIPTGLTQLGEVVVIALALLGVVYAIRPLIAGYLSTQKELATVNRELRDYLQASNRVIDRNADEIKEMRTALQEQTEAHTQLVKALPEMVAQIVKATESAATRTISEVTANADKHDAAQLAAWTEVKTMLIEMRAEIADGHKAQRKEFLDRFDRIIALLTPPPSEPKLTLIGQEKAA